MSVLIVLENYEMPDGCKNCPFLQMEEDISCCELLSVSVNKAIAVNKYSNIRSSKCPMHNLDANHGRILDERDIRGLFSDMPFGNKEVKFSIMDVLNNLSAVDEIAPRHITLSDKVRHNLEEFMDAAKRRIMMSKEDIEKEINNAGEDSTV